MSNTPPIQPVIEQLDGRLTDMGTRLERIEEKLDDHLERVSHAERDISWLRGHARIVTASALSVFGFLALYVAGLLLNK